MNRKPICIIDHEPELKDVISEYEKDIEFLTQRQAFVEKAMRDFQIEYEKRKESFWDMLKERLGDRATEHMFIEDGVIYEIDPETSNPEVETFKNFLQGILHSLD